MPFDNRHTVASRRPVVAPSPPRDSRSFIKGMALGIAVTAATAALLVPAIYAAPTMSPRPQPALDRQAAAASAATPAAPKDASRTEAASMGQPVAPQTAQAREAAAPPTAPAAAPAGPGTGPVAATEPDQLAGPAPDEQPAVKPEAVRREEARARRAAERRAARRAQTRRQAPDTWQQEATIERPRYGFFAGPRVQVQPETRYYGYRGNEW